MTFSAVRRGDNLDLAGAIGVAILKGCMHSKRVFPVILLILLSAGAGFAESGGWTPLRVTVADKIWAHGEGPCQHRRVRTVGFDLGLWRINACSAAGLQLAPLAVSERAYGAQVGLLFAGSEEKVIGVQLGGLATYLGDTDNESYLLQISGLVNNPVFMHPPSMNGVQIAPLGNAAGQLNGLQLGTVNFLAGGHALQGGALNIQVSAGKDARSLLAQLGLLNLAEDLNGGQLGIVNLHGNRKDAPDWVGMGQLGIFNHAYRIKGAQLGVFNKATDVSGVQIGLFNYCARTLKGLQIGFANVGGTAALLPYSIGVNVGF